MRSMIPMEVRIFILLMCLIAYCILMLLYRKRCIQVYVATWIVFPNLGTNMFGIEDIPLYSFIEIAGAAFLLFYSIKEKTFHVPSIIRGYKETNLLSENKLITLFILTLVGQYTFGSWFLDVYYPVHNEVSFGDSFHNTTSEFAGVVFLYAFSKLVTRFEQVESIMKIIVFGGVLVAVEYLVEVTSDTVYGIVGKYAFDSYSQFNSIFINDYNLVGLIAAAGGLSTVYFFKLMRFNKLFWLFAFITCSGLVFVNFKRSVILAYILSLMICLYLMYFKKWKLHNKIVVLIPVSIAVILNITKIPDEINFDLGEVIHSKYIAGRVRAYSSTNSLLSRIGMQTRAVEIIADVFPLGVGNRNLKNYMAGDAPHVFHIKNKKIADGYDRVVNSDVRTNCHNGYIEQVASYGVMGLLSLFALITAIGKNLVGTWYLGKQKSRLSYTWILCVSQTLLYMIFFMFLAYPRSYILVFTTLHLSYMLKKQKVYKAEYMTPGIALENFTDK